MQRRHEEQNEKYLSTVSHFGIIHKFKSKDLSVVALIPHSSLYLRFFANSSRENSNNVGRGWGG